MKPSELQNIVDHTKILEGERFRVTFTMRHPTTGKLKNKTFLVSHDGANFKVKYATPWQKLMAKFHGASQVAKELSEKLNSHNPLVVKENEIEKVGKHRTHHRNVMDFNAIPESITGSKPLIIFDVDEVILAAKIKFDDVSGKHVSDNSKVDAIGGPSEFKAVITKITEKAQGAKILLLTNGRGTRFKLQQAGIELGRDITIDEIPPKPYGLNSKQYTRWRELQSEKGGRLKRFLDFQKTQGKEYDEVHFIDDNTVNLDSLTEETNKRGLRCHTYDFIGAIKESNFKWAIQNPKNLNSQGKVNWPKFYHKKPEEITRRANFNSLKSKFQK
ncbi:DUF2608 domain-containing protein [Parashewanella spongiae]|nr:hypothetical protein [Parashewanella spongiae]MCL1078534.1 DUF2608 domain-containing protein [Parashewanella spongiae]